MNKEFDYITDINGIIYKERKGELYNIEYMFPIKYENLLSNVVLPLTSINIKDFFNVFDKEDLEKIYGIKEKDENFYNRDWNKIDISHELTYALLQDKNTPTNIVEIISGKLLRGELLDVLCARDDLNETMLKNAFKNALFIRRMYSTLKNYLRTGEKLKISQTAINYCAKNLAHEMKYYPFAFLQNKQMARLLCNNAKDKDLAQQMIAENNAFSDRVRENIAFDLSTECNIYDIVNPTKNILKLQYTSICETIEMDCGDKNEEIYKAKTSAINKIRSIIKENKMPIPMQRDFICRLSAINDIDKVMYKPIFNALNEALTDENTIHLMHLTFMNTKAEKYLDELYQNPNVATKTIESKVNNLLQKIWDNTGTIKQEYTNCLCNLCKQKTMNLSLEKEMQILNYTGNEAEINLIQNPSIKIGTIRKLKNSENALVQEIAHIIDGLSLRMTRKEIEPIIQYFINGTQFQPFDTDRKYASMIKKEMGKIKNDVLKISKAPKYTKTMFDNFINSVDYAFTKAEVLQFFHTENKNGGLSVMQSSDIQTLDENQVKFMLTRLSLNDCLEILNAYKENYLTLITISDNIDLYLNIDKYCEVFNAFNEVIRQKEKEFEEREVDENER